MGYNILLTVILSSTIFHPIHVTICEMEYDINRKAIEVTQRIFLDDLEKEIREDRGDPQLDIYNPKNGLSSDDIFKEYLKKHIKIEVNGKAEAFNYLGHELEGNVGYFYFEIEKIKKLKSIKVFNDILTGTYKDQINLVHVEYQDEIKSLKLDPKNLEGELIFD